MTRKLEKTTSNLSNCRAVGVVFVCSTEGRCSLSRVTKFAGAVATAVGDSDKVGFIEWLVPIITLITNLPCLQPKTAAEVHQDLIDKPKRAVTQLTHQIMGQADNDKRRKQARQAAAETVAKAAAMSRAAFVAAFNEARAA